MHQSAVLCAVCLDAFAREHDCDETYQHHTTIDSFRQAQQMGCHLCSVLWEISRGDPADATWDFRKSHSLNVTYELWSHQPTIYFRMDAENLRTASLMITLQPVQGISDKAEPPHSDGSLIPSSLTHTRLSKRASRCLDVCARWLKACTDTHDGCPKPPGEAGTTQQFPTRILDLRQYDSGAISLRETDGTEKGLYMTLSHRWGTQRNPPLLFNANLVARKARIPLADLPETFRDAMQVTRHLGVDWLWIDSLCIIQDSVEDWRRESSQMGRIYRNSLCNIAATGAAEGGGGGGGLFPRDSIVASQLFLNLSILRPGDKTRPPGSGPCDTRALYRYRLSPWSLWPAKVDDAALGRRGWVVQERVLAPRALHFADTQAFWECVEKVACEALPDSLEPGGRGPVTRFSGIRRVLAAARASATSSRGSPVERLVRDWVEVRDAWLQLTQSYIQCLLTKETDRLVALSGIAKEIRAMTGDEYIAGNWKSMIIESALWYNLPDGTRLARTRPLEAPTWSWSSIKPYALVYQYQFRTNGQQEPEQLVEYVGHSVDPYGTDDTGQLHSAQLQVRGKLFSGVEEVRQKNRVCDCRSCKPKSPFFPRHEDAVDILGWRFFHRVAYHDEDDLAESADSTLRVWYLPVVVQQASINSTDIEIRMLMLKPIAATTSYERIGMTDSVTKMSVSDTLLDDFVDKYRRCDGSETITLV